MQISGNTIYNWAKELFPINRSITGNGVRETLNYIKNIIPDLKIFSVPTGYKAFDWVVPKEWEINEAYIEDENNNRVVDFRNNNLHVVGYSIPVDLWLELDELNKNLYSLVEQPDAIPYVTSYYKSNWGFCIAHNKRELLKPGKYHAVIKSCHKEGVLNYAEFFLPGRTEKEIFLSTYICHPSMANNELSGPVVATALAKWLGSQQRKYSYRIIFIPETIGSIVYLSKNLEILKKNTIAGYNITCIGDENCYSFLPSKQGNSISDIVARHILKHIYPNFKEYSWLSRGSDERQYCAPGIDLPIATITRSKFKEYPEYHTSLDNLEFITPEGLFGGFLAIKLAIEIIEQNIYPRINVLCEPQLSKRGVYPNTSIKGSSKKIKLLMDLITYCDGERSLLEIADLIGESFFSLVEQLKILKEHKLVSLFEKPYSKI